MKKVLVFGTFDGIHKGHLNFLQQAKEKGDYLVVVVARDRNVKKIKGDYPVRKEEERLKDLKLVGIAHKAMLGDLADPYKVISKIKPDIICLGYDQNSFTGNLEKEIEKRKLKVKIIKLKSYKAKTCHSSLINKR